MSIHGPPLRAKTLAGIAWIPALSGITDLQKVQKAVAPLRNHPAKLVDIAVGIVLSQSPETALPNGGNRGPESVHADRLAQSACDRSDG